jgi:DNA processing protein
MAVVVEADDTPEDLAAARIAVALGRTVAAIPGRVTSPLSRGTHALLMDGATLVRGPRDVLELLYTVGTAEQCEPPPAPVGAPTDTGLQPHLRAILERVGSGCDTPDKLARAGVEPSAAVLALSELEVIGLLARGDGGRYMPRNAL